MSRSPEPPRPGHPRPPSDRQGDSSAATLALHADDFLPRTEAQRGDLARRVHGWAGQVLARLRASGLTLTADLFEDAHATHTQGVIFSAGTRTSLVLLVGADRVRAGLELSSARARAVLAALGPERALEVQAALEALPEQFEVAVEGDASAVPAPHCTIDVFRSKLEQASQGGLRLWIGWTVSRELAVSHAALLDEQLTDALVLLAPMLALLAGATESRGPGVSRPPSAGSRRKKSGGARTDDDRDHAQARRLSRESSVPDSAGEPAGERHAGAAPHRPEAEVLLEPGARGMAEVHAPARLGLRAGRKAILAARSESSRRRHDVVERGAQVRVLEGPFAGRVGVVQELDGRGGARVMMGLLAVRIDMTNLEVHVEGRRRPVLSTSHRKPVPARS
ncbi:MAG: KOW motif-containing protein [Polyangiaceae bacterium]|nr:KOW motif-containing protein [Polyangiaceae bacterium]